MTLEHRPAPPRSPEPPEGLRRLSETLDHPDVRSVGLTTTEAGDWALLVTVEPDARIPISEIERRAAGFRVFYDRAWVMPAARPAFPARGE